MDRIVREIRRDPSVDHVPQYRAQDLTGDGARAEIELNGQVYSLRITRAGKLILTK